MGKEQFQNSLDFKVKSVKIWPAGNPTGNAVEISSTAVDFSYASENAMFAQTETKLGIIPGAGGTQNLTRAIGERRSKEYILTGKSFDAFEAHQMGLINKVVKKDELINEILLVANKIAENAKIVAIGRNF